MKCKDCEHFIKVRKNNQGGWYGDCPIQKRVFDYYGRRSGNRPACTKFKGEPK